MPKEFIVSVEPAQAGERLDKFLPTVLPGYTRSALQKLIEGGQVLCAGEPLNKKYKLCAGETISVTIPDPEPLDVLPEEIPLDILYEDSDLLVVNKPKHMVVHPAAGNYTGTLVNALLHHCRGSLSGINGVIRPGIVHLIDKDTSGLLIVAKNDQAHVGLAAQIKEHSFDRTYEAVMYGRFVESAGTVDKPIGRSERDRKKMCVTMKNSKPAVTHYEVLGEYGQFTHLRLCLETGRTHQIRVHMASIGHPVAGDPVYGPKKCIAELEGQCLHARSIGFVHPRTGERLSFESELPSYFVRFLDKIRRSCL